MYEKKKYRMMQFFIFGMDVKKINLMKNHDSKNTESQTDIINILFITKIWPDEHQLQQEL